jgi:septal ring factor EnvC (AmiA/AmiB activator)
LWLLALGPVLLAPSAHLSPAWAQSAELSERELRQVRSRIEALQRQLQRQTSRRDTLATELRAAETAAGELARNLATTRTELAAATRRAAELAEQRERAAATALAERAQLAGQLRQAWQAGRQERLQLMLNQQDPAALGRMLVYHDYLNRYRAARLEGLISRLEALRALGEEAARAQVGLERLQARQRDEIAGFEQARAERTAALKRVEAELTGTGDELERLARQEKDLSNLIERLRRELAGFPVDPQTPFASLRGNLAWPAAGAATRSFGDPRGDGSMRWNGVLLGAPRGAPVRAIHHGRVAYSDWLPGMGLLLVIDHGGGYMSLYGHNESLLPNPGDWVVPGETVASVGDSGGQGQAGLYFEIRKDGQPQNPAAWMRGRPQP